jgi:hypothetical protein
MGAAVSEDADVDIASDLRFWAELVDTATNNAERPLVVIMLSGEVFAEAATEIERLRSTVIELRAEVQRLQCVASS